MRKCNNCGAELDDSVRFCSYCGSEIPPAFPYNQPPQQFQQPNKVQYQNQQGAPVFQNGNQAPSGNVQRKMSPLPFIAVGLVILAFVFSNSPLGIVFAIGGFVIAIIGSKRRFRLRGFAIACIPLSVIALLVSALAVGGTSLVNSVNSSGSPSVTEVRTTEESKTSKATQSTTASAATTAAPENTTPEETVTPITEESELSAEWQVFLEKAEARMASVKDCDIEISGNTATVTNRQAGLINAVNAIMQGYGSTEQRQSLLETWRSTVDTYVRLSDKIYGDMKDSGITDGHVIYNLVSSPDGELLISCEDGQLVYDIISNFQ